jgi:hypothetical protein
VLAGTVGVMVDNEKLRSAVRDVLTAGETSATSSLGRVAVRLKRSR